jgi:hypothetical protein
MARALTVAPATKSGGSASASVASGLPAWRERRNDMGLVVEHHLGSRNAAAEIDAGDHVERRARVTGRRDDIEGREYIGDDLAALEDRDRRRRAFFRSEPFRATGKDFRHDFGWEPFPQLALFGNGR